MARPIWLLLFLVLGCSASQAKRRPDGTYLLQCDEERHCLERAQRVCGESGYMVLGGKNDRKVYGTPGNQTVVGKNELHIRCSADRAPDAPDPQQGTWKLPPRRAQAPVCRPGETQRCVGPAACEGGQACLSDGSGFAPCDCGQAQNRVPVSPADASTTNPTPDAGSPSP